MRNSAFLAPRVKMAGTVRGENICKPVANTRQEFLTPANRSSQKENSNCPISWLKVSRWWGVRPYSRMARQCSRVG